MPARISSRFWHTSAPVVLLVVLVVGLSVVQYRWLGQLGASARERLDRDLRVATQSVANAVEDAVAGLVTALDAAPPDSASTHRVLRAWEASNPGLAGLVGAVGRPEAGAWRWLGRAPDSTLLPLGPFTIPRRATVRWDSTFIANALLPALAARIASATELAVTVALVHRDSSGGTSVVARTAPLPDAPADVATPLLTGDGELTMIFVGGRGRRAPGDAAPGMVWTGDSAGAEGPITISAGYELRAWHAAGSLERAVAGIQRRNLAIGFGLLVLLTIVGAQTLLASRRNQRLAEDRATVLAGISHEIRTPLAVIRSAADNLRSGVVGSDAAVAEYGAMIEAEAERLAGTVASAVAFARTADRTQAWGHRVELVPLVQQVVAESAAPERVVVTATGTPACRGDGEALAMAVRNLVANALDYAAGDSTVAVTLETTGRSVAVAVADRGPGLPDGEYPRILDPFVRGSAGRAARQGGLGLGLALAHRVAAWHGGSLTAAARPGGGTVFTLHLPLAPA